MSPYVACLAAVPYGIQSIYWDWRRNELDEEGFLQQIAFREDIPSVKARCFSRSKVADTLKLQARKGERWWNSTKFRRAIGFEVPAKVCFGWKEGAALRAPLISPLKIHTTSALCLESEKHGHWQTSFKSSTRTKLSLVSAACTYFMCT